MEETSHHTAIREELVAAATLGTARRAFELPPASGTLGAALAQIDLAHGSEQALLHAAALVTSFEQAGYQVPRAPDGNTSPAAADTMPTCSPVAAQHLVAILKGDQALLSEWLSLLVVQGKRVPVQFLPELLEAGKQSAATQRLVRAAIGARGQWLASQYPDWQYGSIDISATQHTFADLAEKWQTATQATRLAMLHATRSATPEVARALIESTWTSDKADERAALLKLLRDGLSMDDEPFLEAALDDRSKQVRKAAADLLAHLPESRLVCRMVARVTPLLQWKPPGNARLFGLMQGKPGSIVVTLPEACDKAMLRDGLDADVGTNVPAASNSINWLMQMLRTIPPSYWERHWQAKPEEIVRAEYVPSEYGRALKQAWANTILAHRDATWAEAVLRNDFAQQSLLLVLHVERQEAVLLDVLKRATTDEQRLEVAALLRISQHQWSEELSRAALATLVEEFKRLPERAHYTLVQTLNAIAYRCSPALLPAVNTVQMQPEAVQTRWNQASERLRNTLQFRHDMEQALR